MTDEDYFGLYTEQFLPKQRDWLREHPEMVKDIKTNARLLLVHSFLTKALRIRTGSKRYFEHLDFLFGFRKLEKEPNRRSGR